MQSVGPKKSYLKSIYCIFHGRYKQFVVHGSFITFRDRRGIKMAERVSSYLQPDRQLCISFLFLRITFGDSFERLAGLSYSLIDKRFLGTQIS